MKKAFWLAPVIALIAFIGVYIQSRTEIEEKARLQKEAADAEHKKQVDEQKRRFEEAKIKRAQDLADKKKKDEEEKKRKDEEEKHKQDIEYARDFARREAARYENVVKELNETLTAEKTGKEEADKVIADMKKEKEFLLGYVATAQANQKVYKDLLSRLEAMEAARAKAEEAAKRQNQG